MSQLLSYKNVSNLIHNAMLHILKTTILISALIFLLTYNAIAKEEAKGDVIAIGQGLYDLVVKLDSDEQLNSIIKPLGLKKGDASSIDHATLLRLIKHLNITTQKAGGSAANTLTTIASLGGKTSLFSIVGDDKFGKAFENSSQNAGILNRIIVKDDDVGTGIVLVLVAPDGERTLLAFRGNSLNFNEEDINFFIIEKYKVLFTEAYLFLGGEHTYSLITHAFKVAKQQRVITALSLSDKYIVEKYRNNIMQLLPDIDILFSNEQELITLFAAKNLQEAILKAQFNTKLVITTIGARGCIIITPNKVMNIKGIEVKKVVDTSGAGDAFAAGFLYAYTKGQNLKQAALMGNTVAAKVIQQLGARMNN